MADLQINIDLTRVESFASRGLTEEQIADSLGLSLQTIKSDPRLLTEFTEAYRAGEAKGIATISNLLFQKARQGDTQAMIFFLKAKGWSDKPSLQPYKGK